MQLTPMQRLQAYKYCRKELGYKRHHITQFDLVLAHKILIEIENYRRAA